MFRPVVVDTGLEFLHLGGLLLEGAVLEQEDVGVGAVDRGGGRKHYFLVVRLTLEN